MIDRNKYNQYGFERQLSDVRGITLHCTNNYEMSARDVFNWLNEENKNSNGCHYLVDNEEIIEVMPHDWAVYHTGKGLDYGNQFTIAIEICSNLDNEKYLLGQAKAIELIKELMEEYNLTTNELYFHNDFYKQYYCPATILDLYGNKKNFIEKFF